jgi:hypothetical protein
MDKLSHYRSVVKQVLSQHAEYIPSHGQIETISVFDERNENYLLLDLGWDRTGRVHAAVLHLRLRDDKVWIEKDGTETGIAQELLEAGIPKEDIVLGFYRPERRASIEYAAV